MKKMNKSLILAVILLVFFFGYKPAGKWLGIIQGEKTEEIKQKVTTVKKHYSPPAPIVILPEVPQDNVLDKANQYTDQKVGEVREDVRKLDTKVETYQEENRQGFKSTQDLIREQREKTPVFKPDREEEPNSSTEREMNLRNK